MLKTLRARLIAGYLGVVLVGLLLAGGAFILLMLRVQNDLVYRSLATNAPLILPQIREARATPARACWARCATNCARPACASWGSAPIIPSPWTRRRGRAPWGARC